MALEAWKAILIDLSNGTATVSRSKAVVKGVYVDVVMSAHSVTIDNGSSSLLTIPASTAAGTVIDFAGEKGVYFDTNLIITPNASSTGTITIFYTDRV